MKHKYFQFIFLLGILSSMSCTKEGRIDYYQTDDPPPAQVSDVKIIPTEGGAYLKYTIPSDPNMAYVKAVYEIQPNVTREAKSSIYSDTLKLEGFGDTLQHEVKIFSVGKNEKVSEAVTISVTPKTPPILTIFDHLNMVAGFGGVTISYQNPTKAKVSIELLVDTTGQNTWSPLNVYYTETAVGKFSTRGMQSVERKFAVLVRDRWNNKSDTLILNLTPKFETQIPKGLWKNLKLPTDTYLPVDTPYPMEKLWDGLWATLSGQCFATPNTSSLPQWCTIDLGQKVLISRFKEHQAPSSHLYVGSALKKFELWGTNNPSPDGSFTNWQLLGTFESFKPSGLPLGQTTAEDKNYANFLGEDFEFENQPPAVRYIRLKSLETYSSSGQVVIGELTLFGEVQP